MSELLSAPVELLIREGYNIANHPLAAIPEQQERSQFFPFRAKEPEFGAIAVESSLGKPREFRGPERTFLDIGCDPGRRWPPPLRKPSVHPPNAATKSKLKVRVTEPSFDEGLINRIQKDPVLRIQRTYIFMPRSSTSGLFARRGTGAAIWLISFESLYRRLEMKHLAVVLLIASAVEAQQTPDPPLEKTKKNIRVLSGVPSSQLIPIMTVMAIGFEVMRFMSSSRFPPRAGIRKGSASTRRAGSSFAANARNRRSLVRFRSVTTLTITARSTRLVPFVLTWSRGDYEVTHKFAEVTHNVKREPAEPSER